MPKTAQRKRLKELERQDLSLGWTGVSLPEALVYTPFCP